MTEPCANECQNDHRDDYWTCPGCYTDLGDVGVGSTTCLECGRTVLCRVDHFPSCVAVLVEKDK